MTDRPWDPFAPVATAGQPEPDDAGRDAAAYSPENELDTLEALDAAELADLEGDDGLEGMRKDDLVDLAKRLRLPTSGTKPELIERIRDHRA